MKYRVRLQPAARENLDDAYENAAQHAPVTASAWLDRFYVALQSLSVNPGRCVLAPENPSANALSTNTCLVKAATSFELSSLSKTIRFGLFASVEPHENK